MKCFAEQCVLPISIAVLACFTVAAPGQTPITTSFTYQGELNNADVPVEGAHDMRFSLFDAASGGAQVGSTLCVDNLQIVRGRFTVSLDFGNAYVGQRRFLRIEVRADDGSSCGDAGGFTVLEPLQELASVPFSAFAIGANTSATASNAALLNGQPGSHYLNAMNLTGTLPQSALPPNIARLDASQAFTGQVTLSNVANQINGTFLGSGAGLTNLNAGALVGFVPMSALPSAVARRDGPNEFGSFTNSFLGNVGVGTSSPLARLDVSGQARISGPIRTSATPVPSSDLGLYSGNDGNWLRLVTNNAPIQFFLSYSSGSGATPGEPAMTLSNVGGNLGIGTASPSNRLTVVGNGSFTGNLGVGTNTPTAKLEVVGGPTVLEQEPWQTPTLLNGWANSGSDFATAGYFKDSVGMVHLRGTIGGGSSIIFILPPGYRPAGRSRYNVATGQTVFASVAQLEVRGDGSVLVTSNYNGNISLDGIRFRAEQ